MKRERGRSRGSTEIEVAEGMAEVVLIVCGEFELERVVREKKESEVVLFRNNPSRRFLAVMLKPFAVDLERLTVESGQNARLGSAEKQTSQSFLVRFASSSSLH